MSIDYIESKRDIHSILNTRKKLLYKSSDFTKNPELHDLSLEEFSDLIKFFKMDFEAVDGFFNRDNDHESVAFDNNDNRDLASAYTYSDQKINENLLNLIKNKMYLFLSVDADLSFDLDFSVNVGELFLLTRLIIDSIEQNEQLGHIGNNDIFFFSKMSYLLGRLKMGLDTLESEIKNLEIVKVPNSVDVGVMEEVRASFLVQMRNWFTKHF